MTTAAAPAPTRAAGVVSSPTQGARLDAIDLLRGIVMVVMALDHTRDFALNWTLFHSATDPTSTTPAIFLTRWVTHFCAPVFVLLAGTGISLQQQRGKSIGALSRFLVTRGLWLILLEFTVVRAGWLFDLDYGKLFGFFQVIWAIGFSMIVMAALIRLPAATVGVIGLALISFHNVLDRVAPATFWRPGLPEPSRWSEIWSVLHGAGLIPLGHPFPLALTGYGLIPWLGVMCAGYALGMVYSWQPEARRRVLLRAGLAVTAAFIAIRLANNYGDPAPWSVQHTPVFTVLSFLNTTKYPPSLDYLLMTLGPALIALAWFDRIREPAFAVRALITFGRVPMFFYLLQWPATHGLSLLAGVLAHKPTAYLIGTPAFSSQGIDPQSGFGLGTTYLIWITVIVILYPLCAWYAGVKRRHRDWWWLSYL